MDNLLYICNTVVAHRQTLLMRNRDSIQSAKKGGVYAKSAEWVSKRDDSLNVACSLLSVFSADAVVDGSQYKVLQTTILGTLCHSMP